MSEYNTFRKYIKTHFNFPWGIMGYEHETRKVINAETVDVESLKLNIKCGFHCT